MESKIILFLFVSCIIAFPLQAAFLNSQAGLGAIHKLRHTNLMIFLPFPVLVTGGHIYETPHLVWRHIFFNVLNSQRLTKFPHVYE
jgi:hypothetical protein